LSRDEIAGGMVLFLFGAITALLSLRMPIGTFRMAGTGMFPLCLGILLMILSGLFLLNLFYHKKKEMEKKESIAEIPRSAKQMIFFFGTMVLATLFFKPTGISIHLFSFNGGSPENSRNETMGPKYPDICGDGYGVLFSIRSMA
jgi:hypothetical protein